MSSAGHIMDMIQRMKQNKAYLVSKKASFKNRYMPHNHSGNDVHVPDDPGIRLKESKFVKYFNAAVILILLSILAFLFLM